MNERCTSMKIWTRPVITVIKANQLKNTIKAAADSKGSGAQPGEAGPFRAIIGGGWFLK